MIISAMGVVCFQVGWENSETESESALINRPSFEWLSLYPFKAQAHLIGILHFLFGIVGLLPGVSALLVVLTPPEGISQSLATTSSFIT